MNGSVEKFKRMLDKTDDKEEAQKIIKKMRDTMSEFMSDEEMERIEEHFETFWGELEDESQE